MHPQVRWQSALTCACPPSLPPSPPPPLLLTFAGELSAHFQELLQGFPSRPGALLQALQKGVREKEQGLRWERNWDTVAWPVISANGSPKPRSQALAKRE